MVLDNAKRPNPSRVLVLNYHEVTEDPRVLKQSRGLVNAGHDVTVFCDLKPGFAKQETDDGLRIERFVWSDASDVRASDLALLRLFTRAYPLAGPSFEKLASLRDLQDAIDDFLTKKGENPADGLPAYKSETGVTRLLAKLRYLRSKKQQAIESEPSMSWDEICRISDDIGVKTTGKGPNEKKVQSAIRAEKSQLFQSISFLFLMNLSKIAARIPQVDIVHAHDIYTLPAGAWIAETTGAKLIYDAHEYEVGRGSRMPVGGPALADAIERDGLDRATALITVSDSIADLYAERFERRAPVVVMNAPDISEASFVKTHADVDRPSIRSRLEIADDVPLAVFTGWVQRERRGLHVVAAALAHVPDFHLVVIGPRHVNDDAWLMEIAEAAGVADRVHLLDPVDHADVVPVISECDIALVPFQDASISYRYAMPNKLFEAAFAGLPIAVSNLPDMSRFVENFGIGLVMDETDPESIAKTMTRLHAEPEKYRLVPNERRRMIETFGWDAQVVKLLDLYEDLGEATATDGDASGAARLETAT